MRHLLLVSLLLTGCLKQRYSDWSLEDQTSPAVSPQQGRLISAFFGLDNTLPKRSERLCPGADGMDGLPLIFSEELDLTTMEAGDIVVIGASGARRPVHCITMGPAIDRGELRTGLLVGEFGGPGDDPPASVEVSGHLLSLDGAYDFKGASVAVTPLVEGPSLVLAEAASPAEYGGKRAKGLARGTRCPDGTQQAIRVIWAGGITKPGGEPADSAEGSRYALNLEDGSVVAPDALADLRDNDNNHLLCLNHTHKVVKVSFPKGLVTDPNEDLNPATEIPVR